MQISSGVPAWVAGGSAEVCYDIVSLDEDGLNLQNSLYGVEITDGSSPVFAKTIVTVSFWLRKSGTPEGDGYCYIYSDSGALQATSDSPTTWSALSGSWSKKTFTFAAPHTIAVGDKIVIGGGTVGIGKEVSFYGDQNNTHTTFQSLVKYDGAWAYANGVNSGARWCYTA